MKQLLFNLAIGLTVAAAVYMALTAPVDPPPGVDTPGTTVTVTAPAPR